MIILDTNVISEPLRPRPDPRVLSWLNQQKRELLFVTVTNLAELKMGIAILPSGKKKATLQLGVVRVLKDYFGPRILNVTEGIADLHAAIFAEARRKGVAIGFADAQIAAIAKSRGFVVATRDVKPFDAAGVEVVDPWK